MFLCANLATEPWPTLVPKCPRNYALFGRLSCLSPPLDTTTTALFPFSIPVVGVPGPGAAWLGRLLAGRRLDEVSLPPVALTCWDRGSARLRRPREPASAYRGQRQKLSKERQAGRTSAVQVIQGRKGRREKKSWPGFSARLPFYFWRAIRGSSAQADANARDFIYSRFLNFSAGAI